MGILPMIPRTRVARVKIVSETVLMYAYIAAASFATSLANAGEQRS